MPDSVWMKLTVRLRVKSMQPGGGQSAIYFIARRTDRFRKLRKSPAAGSSGAFSLG
jgi:hypothetical protein